MLHVSSELITPNETSPLANWRPHLQVVKVSFCVSTRLFEHSMQVLLDQALKQNQMVNAPGVLLCQWCHRWLCWTIVALLSLLVVSKEAWLDHWKSVACKCDPATRSNSDHGWNSGMMLVLVQEIWHAVIVPPTLYDSYSTTAPYSCKFLLVLCLQCFLTTHVLTNELNELIFWWPTLLDILAINLLQILIRFGPEYWITPTEIARSSTYLEIGVR